MSSEQDSTSRPMVIESDRGDTPATAVAALVNGDDISGGQGEVAVFTPMTADEEVADEKVALTLFDSDGEAATSAVLDRNELQKALAIEKNRHES